MSADTKRKCVLPMSARGLRIAASVVLPPFMAAFAGTAQAEDARGAYAVATLAPETALAAAQAALKYCRDSGWQVTVAVVDRSAVPLVVLRDRYAGFHTLDTGIGKARTAVSFRTPTGQLAESTQAGKPESGIRAVPGVIMVSGGLPVEMAGSIVGGIGVSGAPGGENDERCATAGIKAIEDQLF
jgi:uncharacterized protein GlcG (DUF336 family)